MEDILFEMFHDASIKHREEIEAEGQMWHDRGRRICVGQLLYPRIPWLDRKSLRRKGYRCFGKRFRSPWVMVEGYAQRYGEQEAQGESDCGG